MLFPISQHYLLVTTQCQVNVRRLKVIFKYKLVFTCRKVWNISSLLKIFVFIIRKRRRGEVLVESQAFQHSFFLDIRSTMFWLFILYIIDFRVIYKGSFTYKNYLLSKVKYIFQTSLQKQQRVLLRHCSTQRSVKISDFRKLVGFRRRRTLTCIFSFIIFENYVFRSKLLIFLNYFKGLISFDII